jgi:hypothetical protein
VERSISARQHSKSFLLLFFKKEVLSFAVPVSRHMGMDEAAMSDWKVL